MSITDKDVATATSGLPLGAPLLVTDAGLPTILWHGARIRARRCGENERARGDVLSRLAGRAGMHWPTANIRAGTELDAEERRCTLCSVRRRGENIAVPRSAFDESDAY